MKIEFIKLKEVIETSKLSKATIYRKIKKSEFPPTISLGKKSVAFLKHEISEYMFLKIKNENVDEKLIVSMLLEQRNELLSTYLSNYKE